MMTRKTEILALSLILMTIAAPVCAAQVWNLVLPDTVVLDRDVARLGDLTAGPVPANVQDLVIRAGLKPNGVVPVSRKDILRRLVTAGLARGVRLTGAEQCHLVFAGIEVTPEHLHEQVSAHLQKLVPPPNPGAPDSWFELEVPAVSLAAAGSWHVESERTERFTPGRNLVRITIVDDDRNESVTATATLHQFGEVGRLSADIKRDSPVEARLLDWEWKDLSTLDRGLVVDRNSILGFSSTRNLTAGQYLRESDLKETPIVLAGDPVALQVVRGQVAVTVRAFARQNGCLGQTIPVRNEMTGRLVNARVAGPGIVEWRR
jgi:flagella basal body P-ring formation protein FlgA